MGKTKTFITVMPFQKEGALHKSHYVSTGNVRLDYGETRFPIIPVINGYSEEGDKIRVIVVLIDGENYKNNFDKYFLPELGELVKTKKLDFGGVEIIEKVDCEDLDTQLKLFRALIDKVRDEEEIYACVTYGRKIEPIVEIMALNYAYKLKKDVSVGCVVYGLYSHNPGTDEDAMFIYDVTALFYTNSIVDKLAEMKVKDPERAIRAMLAAGEGGSDD